MVLLLVPLVGLPCSLIFLLWVFPWVQGRRPKRKKHVLETGVFSWFSHTDLYVTLVGNKERRKNEKNPLCKTCFFLWFAHTGLYGIQRGHGRWQKRKNNILESVVFWWFAHTGLYATPVGSKEGGKNEKNLLCKTCFFRGLPIRASMSPLWEAKKE